MTTHDLSAHADAICSKVFGVSIEDIRGRQRTPIICDARHTAWQLLRTSKLTYKEIGDEYGANHSTVMSAMNRVVDLAWSDVTFKLRFDLCNLRYQEFKNAHIDHHPAH